MQVPENVISEGANCAVPDCWWLINGGDVAFAEQTPGGLVIVRRFIYTTAVLTGVRFEGEFMDYERRFCFDRAHTIEAILACSQAADWLPGDPPGPWIKEKETGRLGPGATA